MIEAKIFELVTGEFGGLVAVAYALGVITSWGFFDKKVLSEHKKVTERLRKEIEVQRIECRAENDRLDRRIKDLESQVLTLISRPPKPYISEKFKKD